MRNFRSKLLQNSKLWVATTPRAIHTTFIVLHLRHEKTKKCPMCKLKNVLTRKTCKFKCEPACIFSWDDTKAMIEIRKITSREEEACVCGFLRIVESSKCLRRISENDKTDNLTIGDEQASVYKNLRVYDFLQYKVQSSTILPLKYQGNSYTEKKNSVLESIV